MRTTIRLAFAAALTAGAMLTFGACDDDGAATSSGGEGEGEGEGEGGT